MPARSARGRRRPAGATIALFSCLAVARRHRTQLQRLGCPGAGVRADCPWVGSTAPINERVDQLIAAMTPEQKITVLDMEMPGDAFFGQALLEAVGRDEVTQRVDDMARRVLTQMFEFGLFDRGPTRSPDAVVTTPEHVTTARDVSAEGSPLLNNADNILPLNGYRGRPALHRTARGQRRTAEAAQERCGSNQTGPGRSNSPSQRGIWRTGPMTARAGPTIPGAYSVLVGNSVGNTSPAGSITAS